MIGRDRLKDEWLKEQARLDGQALRQWRLRPEHDLTQEAMAALLGLRSRNAVRSIQDWESGRTKIPDWVPRMMWLLDRVEKAVRWGSMRTEMADGETPWTRPPREKYVHCGFESPPTRKYTKRKLEYWALHPGWHELLKAEQETMMKGQSVPPAEGTEPAGGPT